MDVERRGVYQGLNPRRRRKYSYWVRSDAFNGDDSGLRGSEFCRCTAPGRAFAKIRKPRREPEPQRLRRQVLYLPEGLRHSAPL
jgi:hypothetical protein